MALNRGWPNKAMGRDGTAERINAKTILCLYLPCLSVRRPIRKGPKMPAAFPAASIIPTTDALYPRLRTRTGMYTIIDTYMKDKATCAGIRYMADGFFPVLIFSLWYDFCSCIVR